jgi:hypothetical protein
MPTDTPLPVTNRPRPWLLVALGLALAVFLATRFWPSPEPAQGAAPGRAQPRAGAKAAGNGTVDPEELKVRLEALKEARPGPGEVDRNPFRFKPPPPPPEPKQAPPPVEPEGPVVPPPPPPPPPIPLKFIGIVEGRGVGKVAAFSDCKRTFYGHEGEIVDGRYRLLKIGVESVTMIHADGRGGPQTIRLSGQDCIGK